MGRSLKAHNISSWVRAIRMISTRSRAFTFIEVLVTMVIIGVIATSAMIPMVFMVRQLEDTEKDLAGREGMRRAAGFISREITRISPVPDGPAMRVLRKDVLGGGREDLLLFWCSTSFYSGRPPGSVLYMISSLPEKAGKGLYRYYFPSILPREMDLQKVDTKNIQRQLILPEVIEMSLSVWDGKKWVDVFDGPYPGAVKIVLKRDPDNVVEEFIWLPR